MTMGIMGRHGCSSFNTMVPLRLALKLRKSSFAFLFFNLKLGASLLTIDGKFRTQ